MRLYLYPLYLKLLNYFCHEIYLHGIFQKYIFYLNWDTYTHVHNSSQTKEQGKNHFQSSLCYIMDCLDSYANLTLLADCGDLLGMESAVSWNKTFIYP